jgi:hypothetical protein
MTGKTQAKKTPKPVYKEIAFRATVPELAEITRAAQMDAAVKGGACSRNAYCLRILLAEARRVLNKDGKR